ncbi:MAG: hypothetical protein AAF215_05400 [Cyanobacteria bacterium P01_A01_bin.123]
MPEDKDKDKKRSNVPEPGKEPKPTHVNDWTPEEYLEDLEEDQDDRRNNNR